MNKDGGTLELVVSPGKLDVSVTGGDARHGDGAGTNEVVLVDKVLVHNSDSQERHFWEGHLE